MLSRWFRRRPPQAQIDDATWARALHSLPVLQALPEEASRRLRELCEVFVREKRFSGARGFEMSALARTAIAAQACLPVLSLGLQGYRDFIEIIVYPAQFLVPRRRTDEAGVVHEAQEWLAGEAMQGGPVVLSWDDVAAGDGLGSVVIHEFVHKLDMLDGEADGVPPLPAGQRARWEATLAAAYEDFCARLDELEREIPIDIDPESEAADAWYQSLPLDPYAATDPAEFFAVSGEAFFVDPGGLQACYPAWFGLLKSFFRQDPLSTPPG